MTCVVAEFHAGHWLIDAQPACERIATLRGVGLSLNAIAAGAGVSHMTVMRLASGRQARVLPETAEALAAFDPTGHPDLLVSSLGASRRLRALMATGWDSATLAIALHTSDRQVRAWRSRSSPKIRNGVHLAVAALYRRIGDRRGPNDIARGRARSLGYAAPIHWDDDGDLDNPLSHPKQFCPQPTPRSRKAA